MKDKTVFFCGECGYESARWMGKCPSCGAWNTFVEQEQLAAPKGRAKPAFSQTQTAVALSAVQTQGEVRQRIGIGELDRVLGGGQTAGMVVLLGGDPGIGKSTLLIDAANRLQARGGVLYVSGEESAAQIKLRADRLGIGSDIQLLCDTDLNNAIETAQKLGVQTLIVDSVQTMQAADIASAAGSVSQVRGCAALLTRFAKEQGVAVWMTGHVTKDGAIAGPRVLEHIVDTVLYFEGDRQEDLRILRAVKNRFGSTGEIGVFEMCETGMREVTDPAARFLSDIPRPGCAVSCVLEGTRPLLCEVQALLGAVTPGTPRRFAQGADTGRLNMLLAVIERKTGLKCSDKDVYCNVAGSLKISDRGSDLAIALSVLSALLDKELPEKTAVIGEIGLTGELRPVSQLGARVKECVRLGYTRVIVPAKSNVADAGCVPVKDIREAMARVF
ncbi:MAG: DNA repair protein RadA [Clostridiales bacterium]|nr:DNA repair protein RadA [Clostridiales bacterium]